MSKPYGSREYPQRISTVAKLYSRDYDSGTKLEDNVATAEAHCLKIGGTSACLLFHEEQYSYYLFELF